MLNDQTYQIEEAKISALFKEAGWDVELQVNNERIERIADRAMFENFAKDTTTFVFMSFGTAIRGLVGASFGCVAGGAEINYRA